MITLLNEFKRTIENKLEEKGGEVTLFVAIDNDTNRIRYTNDLIVFAIRECENTLEFESEQDLTFTLGLNLMSLAYLEYDEEYIFSYEDGTKITISII
jgi:hypothetical protein